MDEVASSQSLGLTLGSLELGILCSTVLYGTSLLQTYHYFHAQFTSDSAIVKYLVACVFVTESIHTAFLWTYLYSRTVTEFGRLEAIDEMHWSLSATVPISCAIVFFVESYFAYRVYVISRNKWFPVAAVLGLTLRLGLGTAFGVTTMGYRVSVYFDKFRWLNSTALSVGAVVDIANTVALCFVLKRNTMVLPRTKRIIDKLVLWTIETGLLTSICAIIEVIVMQTKDNLIWAFFFFLSAKLYSNSLLASLNGRVLLQNMQHESMTFGLPTIQSCTETQECVTHVHG